MEGISFQRPEIVPQAHVNQTKQGALSGPIASDQEIHMVAEVKIWPRFYQRVFIDGQALDTKHTVFLDAVVSRMPLTKAEVAPNQRDQDTIIPMDSDNRPARFRPPVVLRSRPVQAQQSAIQGPHRPHVPGIPPARDRPERSHPGPAQLKDQGKPLRTGPKPPLHRPPQGIPTDGGILEPTQGPQHGDVQVLTHRLEGWK